MYIYKYIKNEWIEKWRLWNWRYGVPFGPPKTLKYKVWCSIWTKDSKIQGMVFYLDQRFLNTRYTVPFGLIIFIENN